MHGNSITSIENNEAKRWLIIGAHQAGATDKKIARMCGVNQPSVRRIILNFQKTGSPSIPRKMSKKGTTHRLYITCICILILLAKKQQKS